MSAFWTTQEILAIGRAWSDLKHVAREEGVISSYGQIPDFSGVNGVRTNDGIMLLIGLMNVLLERNNALEARVKALEEQQPRTFSEGGEHG